MLLAGKQGGNEMQQVILIAHGKLAQEMKNSAEMIFGELANFTPIAFLNGEGLETLQEKIEKVIASTEGSTLILADLFCGTPYNASCAIAMKQKDREIEIVSGMSLPIILETATLSASESLANIVKHITLIASETVKVFSECTIEEEEEF